MTSQLRHRLSAISTVSSAFAILASGAFADQVFLDDVIVDGSLCVGQDCVNGEAFGFDTIRLKENNMRIRADDTSTTASFPSVDWQLTFNESSNGGLSKFSVEDLTNSRIPFTIEAAAPSHALYVDDGGRIGMGTSAPVVEMHVKDGDTPTLRLEQDGSSGFTQQTWDLAGNEANFFVRDVTNGSRLPFRVQPGAPTSSIHVGDTGNVGLGTGFPDAEIHVKRSDTSPTQMILENDNSGNPAVQIRLKSNSDNNRRIIALDAAGAQETQISLNNDSIIFAGPTVAGADLWATISATGIVTNIGSCTTAAPCDAVFDPEVYQVPSIEHHAREMWEKGYLPAVGPTRNGEQVNITAKMTAILNELEHAHIYIEELNARIKTLEKADKG